MNFAWGLEYRTETYETEAGDPESYEAGPVIGAPIGTQAGSGLKPEETVDVDRDSVSAYVDLESDITDRFQMGVAARFEDYSDFGNSVNGKLSARYELTPSFAVRSTIGTGFRAPSLTQAFFRGSTTSFGEGGQLENVLNLPTDDPIAVLLGAQDLDAEESVSYNLGFVFTPDNPFRLTVDFYRVDIDNRITLSERIGGPEVTAFIEDQLGIPGVLGVRFFTNAIDTKTEGYDIVADYTFDLGGSSLALSAAYNESDTEVTHVDPNPPELDALGVDNVLFGVEERNTIETASPDDKLILTAQWTSERWSMSRARHALGRGDARLQFRGRLRARADLRCGVGRRPRRRVLGDAEVLGRSRREQRPGRVPGPVERRHQLLRQPAVRRAAADLVQRGVLLPEDDLHVLTGIPIVWTAEGWNPLTFRLFSGA